MLLTFRIWDLFIYIYIYMLDFGIDFSVALRSILEVMYSMHI
jgi:hypothetical protein